MTKAKAVAGEKMAKAAPKAKKQPLQVSSPFDSDANIVPELVAKVSKLQISNKSIEETYQKKTQLEHILLRPDTYVGSIEKHTQALWVFEDGSMVHRNVSFVPGLYKIFDEILVNAADNKQRDPSMDTLKVGFNSSTCSSSSSSSYQIIITFLCAHRSSHCLFVVFLDVKIPPYFELTLRRTI